jgi:adenylate kinase family enzyme
MKRVVIVGPSGAGKTTLAQTISQRLNLPHVELDALFWLPDWQQRPKDDFRDKVQSALASAQWVADGNYTSKAQDIIWVRADTLIWLDYPLRVIYPRLFKRTMQRIIRRDNLWGSGNVETFRTQFMTRDSLFVWVWQTHKRHCERFKAALAVYDHLHLIHHRTPKMTNGWLKII